MHRDLTLPVDFGPGVQILVVLLTPQSAREAELWRRLVSAELPASPVRLLAAFTGDLSKLLPRSQHPLILSVTGVDWTSLAPVDHEDRALAIVVNGSKALVLMVGPPTEDAWDEFQAATLSG